MEINRGSILKIMNHFYQKIQNSVLNKVNEYPIFCLLLFAFILRLYNLQSPLLGFHAWRQSDTAAMARNFYENGYHLLYPQIDWGGNSPGYCETEFPIYSYLVAIIYRFLGVSEAYGRLVSLICALVTIFFLYRLVQDYLGKKVAFWSCFFYTILPLNIYYGRTFQPESPVLMASVGGIYFFSQWLKTEKKWHLLLSAVFIAIACLIKVVPAIYLSLPLFYLAWLKFGRKIIFQPYLWIYTTFVIVPTALWYYHAHQIFLQSGLSFGFWGGTTDRYSWNLLLSFEFWKEIPFRLAVRHFAIAGFPVFIAGLWVKRKTPEERLFDMWILGVILHFIIVAKASYVHEYYQLPLMLPGVVYMGKVYAEYFSLNHQKVYNTLKVALALTLIASLTIYSVDYMRQENPEHSKVFALAQQVKGQTEPQSLLMTITSGDPTLLYLSHRKGWTVESNQIDNTFLDQKIQDKAQYMAGNWNDLSDAQKTLVNEKSTLIYQAQNQDELPFIAKFHR